MNWPTAIVATVVLLLLAVHLGNENLAVAASLVPVLNWWARRRR